MIKDAELDSNGVDLSRIADAADPEVVKQAMERVEANVLTTAKLQARAQANALLATMPDWWKEKLRTVASTHYSCRKGRRATAKVLRDFATWQRETARRRVAQAKDRTERRAKLAAKLGECDQHGLPYPRYVSKVARDSLAEELDSAAVSQ